MFTLVINILRLCRVSLCVVLYIKSFFNKLPVLIYFFVCFSCASGLANLALGKYKAAAKLFLQASVDHCDFPEVRIRYIFICEIVIIHL